MTVATPVKVGVYKTVQAAEQVAALYLSRPDQFVFFDTETTGLNARTNKLVAIQLKQGDNPTVIFDVRDRPEVVKALAPIFEKLTIVGHNLKFDLNWLRTFGIRCVKTTLFDTQIAEQLIHGKGLSEAADAGLGVNLEATAGRYDIPVSKDERGWFYTPAPLDQRPEEWNAPFPEEQVSYMAQDVDVLGRILEKQRVSLKRLGLMPVMRIEMRALPALVEMEYAGIRIDVTGWRAFIAEKEAEAKRLEGEVLAVIGSAILNRRIQEYDLAMTEWRAYQDEVKAQEALARANFHPDNDDGLTWGAYKLAHMSTWRFQHPTIAKPKLDLEVPNLDSTRQLIAGLEALGVPVPTKRNLKGERVPTTESKSLEALATQYPVIKLLLDYRKASKFVTSFGEKLLDHVGADGRIHPDYQQIGAGTGRMSCQRPNWQQVPSKGDGKKLRELVIAAPGCDMLTADFSNIELRILANLTSDPAMLDAFEKGLDLHSETARRMFKLGPDVDPKKAIWKRDLTYRQIAKIINFMLVYGGTPFKLSMEIGIPKEEAEALVEAYFQAYQGVARWMATTKDRGMRDLHAKTLAGRRRPFDDPGREPEMYYTGFKDPEKQRAAYAQFKDRHKEWEKARARVARQALNTPIQGTSADITKLALALFTERVDHRKARLVATVHDELVVETVKSYTTEAATILRSAMKDACDTYLTVSPVPEPDVAVSDHWMKD